MSKTITYRGSNTVEAIAVGVTFRPGQSLEVTDDEAELLLTNHLFTDGSGKNPNFTCASCGVERFATGIFRAGGIAPLVNGEQKPICAPCFTKAATPAPPDAPAPAAAAVPPSPTLAAARAPEPVPPVTAPVTEAAPAPQEH